MPSEPIEAAEDPSPSLSLGLSLELVELEEEDDDDLGVDLLRAHMFKLPPPRLSSHPIALR